MGGVRGMLRAGFWVEVKDTMIVGDRIGGGGGS